ncbi:MAG: isocitrate lyase/phosphoenolpyruvate mutase family protein [Sulfitobacter sp.]
MTDQVQKARDFAALHQGDTPLVLWNIWDAGSAKAVADAGAKAVATGSWSVAAAQGFADGEALPMSAALATATQIVAAVDVPVSVDFEGGYAVQREEIAAHARLLMSTGAVGLNLEDRVVGGKGLHDTALQAGKIAAIRAEADAQELPFFINARTDVFFSGSKAPVSELVSAVLERAAAYAQAGADGLFVPGLTDLDVIAQICAGQPLPVNVMRMGDALSVEALAQAGVKRISHGPGPYMAAMKALTQAAVV